MSTNSSGYVCYDTGTATEKHSRKPGRHAFQVSIEVQGGSVVQIGRHSSIQPFSGHVIVVSQKGKQGTPSANGSFCTKGWWVIPSGREYYSIIQFHRVCNDTDIE